MWRILGTVVEMFVYSAVYMVIMLLCLKTVGALFTTDFEKKISEEANTGLAIICGALFIGIAILLSVVVR
jgi:uncharacterized membrane protein YjfL (UPF0719 family)